MAASWTSKSADLSHPRSNLPLMTPLTVAVLAFESRTWHHQGAKTQAIRDVFGLSASRYYQALNEVIEQPEALVLAPTLTNRLRRLRDTRRRARLSAR